MSDDVLNVLAHRLEADLRTRFPEIVVRFRRDDDGSWLCGVDEGPESWGEADTWFNEDGDLSAADAERLLADVTFKVADNLWPDELTDPWPPCPAHGEHPLNPGCAAGIASWVCPHDSGVVIPVGSLAGK